MDSAGFMRILTHNYGAASWMQVCDTKAHVKGKSDHYFLVGVNEQELNARAILVKGSRYPQTVPRPVVAIIPLCIPLCSPLSEKTELEDQYWTSRYISQSVEGNRGISDVDRTSTNRDTQMECLVKLFALACKSDHESRAIEVCKLMDSQTIQIAIQVMYYL